MYAIVLRYFGILVPAYALAWCGLNWNLYLTPIRNDCSSFHYCDNLDTGWGADPLCSPPKETGMCDVPPCYMWVLSNTMIMNSEFCVYITSTMYFIVFTRIWYSISWSWGSYIISETRWLADENIHTATYKLQYIPHKKEVFVLWF